MRRYIMKAATHLMALLIGFGLGIYVLPILTAPASPDIATLEAMAENAVFETEFQQDLPGNDFLHWGSGAVSLTQTQIVHTGELAPGPDYMVYLVKDFVSHEDDFLPIKGDSQLIGAVKTFKGFALDIPDGVDLKNYTTVLVWCEAFSEFIAAAKYR